MVLHRTRLYCKLQRDHFSLSHDGLLPIDIILLLVLWEPGLLAFNPFTSVSAKSQIDKFPKITNWVKLKHKQLISKVLPQQVSNKWSHLKGSAHRIKP